MASKNWTLAEAVEAYKNNDKNAIADIGRSYPLLADLVSRSISGNADATVELLTSLAEYVTANKVNNKLKELLSGDSEDTAETSDETGATKTPEKKTEKTEKTDKAAAPATTSGDYDSMNAQQIYKLGRERGISFKSTKKADMIAVMIEWDKEHAGGKKSEKTAEKSAAKTESDDPYAGKSAKDLYTMCKERGIKLEPKQDAKVYLKALKAADAEAAKAAESDDENWDDDEGDAKEEKPTAKSDKKADKKADKPAAKKDDEDWDI